jgi:hypothetical protein
MNLDFAVERLYESGWSPVFGEEHYEELTDGRRFPSVAAIRAEFARAGLQLVTNAQADDRHGTVIGSSEPESAVYALAQLREMSGAAQLVMA